MGNPILMPQTTSWCCFIGEDGHSCQQPARFWVGSDIFEDYTEVCEDHVEDVKRDADTVVRLDGSSSQET